MNARKLAALALPGIFTTTITTTAAATLTLVFALGFACVAVAEDAASADGADTSAAKPAAAAEVKIPDYCYGAVDPFKIGDQRKSFFKAAGKDRELSRAEFDASQKLTASKKSDPQTGGFARVFDRWQTLTEYDRDKDLTLSWVETERYRRAFRRVVLNKFDANRDGQLKGPERQKANEAIHSGKLFAAPKNAAVKVKSSSGEAAGDEADETADGEKKAPTKEEIAARQDEIADKITDEIYKKYDTNGDGELDEQERDKMYEGREEEKKQFLLGMYDEDGDGELSPKEASRGEALWSWAQINNRYSEEYLYDLNGDGNISREERTKVTRSMMMEFASMGELITGYADTDGDGQISMEEGQAMGERAQNGIKYIADSKHDEYDFDGNGLLDDNEKADMEMGVYNEVIDQFTYYDADANGVLSSEERSSYFRGMLIMIFEAE